MSRLAKGAIVLALIVMILPTALSELGKALFGSHPHGASSGGFVENMFTGLFWALFGIGLLARLHRFADPGEARTPRERQQLEYRQRATVRRPADDAPFDDEEDVPADDDPELPYDEE
jgi:hypothetical protein